MNTRCERPGTQLFGSLPEHISSLPGENLAPDLDGYGAENLRTLHLDRRAAEVSGPSPPDPCALPLTACHRRPKNFFPFPCVS